MAIKTNRSWTELYYRTVEHYFWRPGDIGRKATGSGEGWAHWRERLDKQEAPLQHILDLFFYIAPDHLLVDTLSSFLGRDIDHVELVTADQKTLDPRIVQPDLVAIGRAQLIFLEMKVNARSSVDQFVKYAIAAHCIAAERPELESTDLLILSRTTEHHKIWHWCTKLALTSTEGGSPGFSPPPPASLSKTSSWRRSSLNPLSGERGLSRRETLGWRIVGSEVSQSPERGTRPQPKFGSMASE